MKAEGQEILVKKKFKVEDRYDDCGDDLSSLGPEDRTMLMVGLSARYELDSDEELIDQDFDRQMVQRLAYPTYPIDPNTVAPPAPGGTPGRGRDPRAAKPERTTCLSCRLSRARDDWEHTREIGQCAYPYDYPFHPMCDACQRRKGRLQHGHSYQQGHCRWGPTDATQLTRANRKRVVPHEPAPKASYDPIGGAPATTDGRELGQKIGRPLRKDRWPQSLKQPVGHPALDIRPMTSNPGKSFPQNPGRTPHVEAEGQICSSESAGHTVTPAATQIAPMTGRTLTSVAWCACSAQTRLVPFGCPCESYM